MRQARGFTLVEAIVVIVITGIVASFVAVFIRLPVQSYLDTSTRIALADTADTALSRMNRELRLALPNSVVVPNPQSIQFVLTKAGGRYVDVNDLPPATIQPLQFGVADPRFDIVGPAPAGRAAILVNDWLVVNNQALPPSNAAAPNRDNVARVTAVASNGGVTRVSLQGTLNTASQPPYRFRVAMGTVTYLCQNGALTRYFTPELLTTGFDTRYLGAGQLLARGAACVFANQPLPVQAGTALVTLSLRVTSPAGESLALVRQTQVENLP